MHIGNIEMDNFTSTWLMVKQHKVTGLKYFCKTSRYDPVKYLGSGTYWTRHLEEHGNEVETLWYQLFEDKDELMTYALSFSAENNIVDAIDESGRKIWANLIPENGIDGGGNKGIAPSDDVRNRLSDTWEVICPNGTTIVITNMLQFCKERNLNPSAMSAVARGKRGSFKGYKCKKLTNNRNVEYSYKEYPYETEEEKSLRLSRQAVKGSNHHEATAIEYEGVKYGSIVEAMTATGKSYYLLTKYGKRM